MTAVTRFKSDWSLLPSSYTCCGAFDSFRLFVVRGKPEDVFPKLFNEWKVTKLTYEYDTEPYSLSRDKAVAALGQEHGVEVIYKISHTLHDIERYYSCMYTYLGIQSVFFMLRHHTVCHVFIGSLRKTMGRLPSLITVCRR